MKFPYFGAPIYTESYVIIISDMNDKTICTICFEDLTPDTFVTYRQSLNNEWLQFPYCKNCLGSLLDSQWGMYIRGLKNADCEASLRHLINIGPPINFRDPYIEEGREIFQFMCNSCMISSKLQDSLDEEKRNLLANKLKEVLPLLRNNVTEVKIDTDVDTQVRTTFDYIACINQILNDFSL